MRTLPDSFTWRKDGKPSDGNWFTITNKAAEDDTEVIIYDEIGFWGTTAQEFVESLNKIETSKITLRLNSPGGEVFDGLAIHNALVRHEAKVSVFVDALAASAASFIAQAGDEIYMAKGSVMMIHDGMAICMGNEEDMLKTAGVLKKLSNNIAGIYADRAGGTVEEWRALMREESWFTADEAVAVKLADSVLENEDEEAEEAVAKWNLAFFNYAGRDKAPNPLLLKERIEVKNKKESEMTGSPTSSPVDSDETTQAADTGAEDTSTDTGADTGTETQPTMQNGQPVFTIGGQEITDPTAVQTAINAFELTQKETRNSNRRAFVEQLASDNKLLASAVEDTVTFVTDLDDKQYASWSALQGSAPAQSLLGNMGDGPGDKGRVVDSTDEPDRATLEATLAMLRKTSMTEEQISKTPTYKALEALEDK